MIWICVFPTLTAVNAALGDRLHGMSTVPRTFVLATLAVPIVIYVLMPSLHRLRVRLLRRGRGGGPAGRSGETVRALTPG